MKTYCLASSSAGNCFIFEFQINGVPTRIMIECGIPLKEISRKLNNEGIPLTSIKACLITHAHGDHCKSAKDISRLGVPLFASKETLQAISCEGYELIQKKPNRVLDGLFVMPFEVEHDIEGAMGFIIKTKEECVFFANDHKRWPANLSAFKPDYVFIECNYDHVVVYTQLGILKRRKKEGFSSKKEEIETLIQIQQHERNVNSHCSLHGTIEGLKKLDLSNCKNIFLMHLSDRFANEYIMKNAVQDKFAIRTYVCKKNGGIK